MRNGVLFAALFAAAAAAAAADPQLVSPGFPPSTVDSQGALHEDWGVFALSIRVPEGARVEEQKFQAAPVPVVVTASGAGTLRCTQTAYRAPIWPRGCDVMTALLENTGGTALEVRFDLVLPEDAAVGERLAFIGGRAVVGLPAGIEAVRGEKRSWGRVPGVRPLPGWGKPAVRCDRGFRNIVAGFGEIPIVYEFAVEPGARRTVVLGFCESHWTVAGSRPVAIQVEGAAALECDPIGAWGHNGPGCLSFEAADANRDGYISVVVGPHPAAVDRFPILNVAWVFKPGTPIDLAQVLLGAANEAAEHYVDAGGPKDQLLYKGGTASYRMTLAPEQTKELTFLVASPGGGEVPDPPRSTWTPATLRKAAEEVWAGWSEP